MATPEGKIKAAVKKTIARVEDLFELSIWQWWPVPSGYGSSKLDCLLHIAGHSIWVETKKPGGEPTARQASDIDDIRSHGIVVFVIDAKECAAMFAFYDHMIWCIANPVKYRG